MTYRLPTKKQAERFQKYAIDRLNRLGFKKVEGGLRDYRLDTPIGVLWASPYDDWIACCFEDVARAKEHLPHGHADRLNPHSGKWNWHGDGLDGDGHATQMLNQFEREVKMLLAKPADLNHVLDDFTNAVTGEAS